MVATTNSSALPQAATTVSIRLWHLINLLSLDAVTVGLTWQLVFTLQFFDRFPSLVESSIIGISIWLAYTADRILDSRRLLCELPHSSRHSFHRQFQTLGLLLVDTRSRIERDLDYSVLPVLIKSSGEWSACCSYFCIY